MNGITKYSFDCVIKYEHKHMMDVMEDAKEAKEQKNHVRYAVRKPSTITLEVSVTDTVVATNEPLTRGRYERSINAYDNFYRLMQERNYLTVITPFQTMSKMMISDFVVTADPDHQNEMYAQIAFKEMIVAPPKPKTGTRPPPEDKTDPPRVSVLTQIVEGAKSWWSNLTK